MYIYIYICIYVYVYIHIYIYMCVCEPGFMCPTVMVFYGFPLPLFF